MSNVILQPCSNPVAQQHYLSTVKQRVALSSVTSHLTNADATALSTFAINQKIGLWGAKPGEDGRNEPRWKRVAPGDYLLFVHGHDQVSYAQVVHTLHNRGLAEHLWGSTQTANGVVQTWEYMFAVNEPVDVSLPKAQLNQLIGRKSNANVQEFVVLDLEPSSKVVGFLSLPSSTANETIVDPPTRQGRKLTTSEPPAKEFDELDAEAMTVRRKEQAYLRKYILPGSTGTCALCERVFPIEFLVAAHIKRRSACSDVEKQDYHNIAMPNCKMGCDELFGRGLVTVDDSGVVVVASTAPDVGPVAVYIAENLLGKEVSFWHSRPGSRGYFEHHRTKDFMV